MTPEQRKLLADRAMTNDELAALRALIADNIALVAALRGMINLHDQRDAFSAIKFIDVRIDTARAALAAAEKE